MKISRIVLFAFSLVAVGSLRDAGAIEVKLVLHAASGQTVPMEGRILVHQVGSDPTHGYEQPIHTAAATPLALAPGAWSLQPDVAGFYGDARAIDAAEPAAVFDMWPTAIVKGTFAVPKGSQLPRRVQVLFDVDDPTRGNAAHEINNCVVRDGVWSCEVAAGTVDLRIRAPKFTSVTRRHLSLSAGATIDLGTIQLATGATVTGSVALPRSWKKDVRTVLVSLTADTIDAHAALPKLVTRPLSRGAFEFTGVTPGRYRVAARAGELSSEEITVEVRPGSESELTRPLELALPASVTLDIRPPLAPDLKPWRVAAFRVGSGSSGTLISEETANDRGLFTIARLQPGAYRFNVSCDRGSFATKEIRVIDSDVRDSIAVDMAYADGVVTLGDRPLGGVNVVVGGSHRERNAAFRTAEDGSFHGAVPLLPEGSWTVSVESEMPAIDRMLQLLPDVDREGHVHLAVRLENGTVSGRVVGDRQAAVERAIVTLSRLDANAEEVRMPVASGGSFLVSGLAAGRYKISAETFDHRASAAKEIMVAADGGGDPLELVVQENSELRGRVLSSYGLLAGVRVTVRPTDTVASTIIPHATDKNGEFSADLPLGTHEADVVVAPPALSMKMFHVALTGQPIELTVESGGGRLRCVVPEYAEDDGARQGYLLHRGAKLPAYALIYMRDAHDAAGERAHTRVLTASLMEPGDYALCSLTHAEAERLPPGVLPSGRCSVAVLAPFGSANLTVMP